MNHYFRYRSLLAATLNFGLKLHLLYLRHAPCTFPKFKMVGEKASV